MADTPAPLSDEEIAELERLREDFEDAAASVAKMEARCESFATAVEEAAAYECRMRARVRRDNKCAALDGATRRALPRLLATIAGLKERARSAVLKGADESAHWRGACEVAEQQRDEALDGRERVTGAELLHRGGEWLSAARSWLQRRTRNGEHVTWGSRDAIEHTFTVADVEDLASEVAAAAMRPQPGEKRVAASLRARWTAEQQRDAAIAERDAARAEIARMKAAVAERLHYDMQATLNGTPENRIVRERDEARKAARAWKKLAAMYRTIYGFATEDVVPNAEADTAARVHTQERRARNLRSLASDGWKSEETKR